VQKSAFNRLFLYDEKEGFVIETLGVYVDKIESVCSAFTF
jgi:hypothetical protein